MNDRMHRGTTEECFLCDGTGVIMNDYGDMVRCPDCNGERVITRELSRKK